VDNGELPIRELLVICVYPLEKPAFSLWKLVNSGEITVSSPTYRNPFITLRLVLRARGEPAMHQYSFCVTDLTNFDSAAGSFQLTDDEAMEFGREYAAKLLDEQPEIVNQGLCVVAFDAEGQARFIQPIGSVH
jgi:hypothetical protein